MKVGFYAPLKSPDHPVPSGDRKMARLLIRALEMLGHEVVLISEFRSWEGQGDPLSQQKIVQKAQQEFIEVEKRISDSDPLDCIFVYHLYHKAPDWIGCRLSEKLNIPYLVAEASFAPKQSGGKWDLGHTQVKYCIKKAKGIISLNQRDRACIDKQILPRQHHICIPPFIEAFDTDRYSKNQKSSETADKFKLDSTATWLICVAMMRKGDKYESYKRLNSALHQLQNRNWNLIVIGDGVMRSQIEALFFDLYNPVLFAGELESEQVKSWLEMADVYVWPGYNEAYGLGLLEGIAAGLPAVSYDYGGIPSIISNNINGYVVEPEDQQGFVNAMATLIDHQDIRQQMSHCCRQKFIQQHTLEVAANRIGRFLTDSGTSD